MKINKPDIVAEVADAFARYEAALVANDVPALDAAFWNSSRTVRYGIADVQHGFAAVQVFRAAQPQDPSERRLSETVVTTFGDDFATVSTLFRREGNPKLGRQMQTWARLSGRWRVVAAHVSLIDPPMPGDAADGR